jgi:hypothetical protein
MTAVSHTGDLLPTALVVGCICAAIIGYDARGRRWHGWFSAGTWTTLAFLFSIFAIPFYVVARARSTKRVPGSAPAGWYVDPRGGGERYWSGSEWTPHTRR